MLLGTGCATQQNSPSCGDQVQPVKELVDVECPAVIPCLPVPATGSNEDLLRWSMHCGAANKAMRETEK
jgi:hypothetical protein